MEGRPPTHIPVLRDRCLELFRPAVNRALEEHITPVLVDGTLGMGGHSEAFLTAFPRVQLVGIDRDPQALAKAGERLEPFRSRLDRICARYDEMTEVLLGLGKREVTGVLLDLGLSSLQIEETSRGFSYSRSAPLDMRMNPDEELTAADIVNEYSEDHLAGLIRQWGEERYAGRIARGIVAQRRLRPFETTQDLVAVIAASVPVYRIQGHPAKRTFQALRIAVNRELESLEAVLPQALDALRVGGRCLVLSYHSLEDRLVKQNFLERTVSRTPRGLPVEREVDRPEMRSLIRGVERPSEQEIEDNPRAASAKLRAVERIFRRKL